MQMETPIKAHQLQVTIPSEAFRSSLSSDLRRSKTPPRRSPEERAVPRPPSAPVHDRPSLTPHTPHLSPKKEAFNNLLNKGITVLLPLKSNPGHPVRPRVIRRDLQRNGGELIPNGSNRFLRVPGMRGLVLLYLRATRGLSGPDDPDNATLSLVYRFIPPTHSLFPFQFECNPFKHSKRPRIRKSVIFPTSDTILIRSSDIQLNPDSSNPVGDVSRPVGSGRLISLSGLLCLIVFERVDYSVSARISIIRGSTYGLADVYSILSDSGGWFFHQSLTDYPVHFNPIRIVNSASRTQTT
ncbi:hypothetical protein KGM_201462 [Danaus plexippus plexippus]|uniref:Uncharacterized protein n=1 Tax=Danaus plexippus plexippus TaxID=278856 RepID=A0A212FIE8_DANPL|nr:hypothetical protein KGM_201462 [Danaus plexippus plexippus]